MTEAFMVRKRGLVGWVPATFRDLLLDIISSYVFVLQILNSLPYIVPTINLKTFRSNISNFFSRDHVSLPYITTSFIISLYIRIFRFCEILVDIMSWTIEKTYAIKPIKDVAFVLEKEYYFLVITLVVITAENVKLLRTPVFPLIKGIQFKRLGAP